MRYGVIMKNLKIFVIAATLVTTVQALSGAGDITFETEKLIASPTQAGDTVAFSVAADNQTIVLGAYRKNYPDNGPDSGALYVFDKEVSSWSQVTDLAATDGSGFDYLGWSVDIAGDVIAAGATWADEPTLESGGVYIFRLGATWEQETVLAPADLPDEANFGHAVDLDGERLIVGAPFIDGSVNAQGVVYIFADDGQWTQEARLTPGDLDVNFVGADVAIDGDWAVIGAPRDNTDGVSAGSVFIYHRNAANEWMYYSRLARATNESYCYFGNNVCIEGNTILVGAEYSSQFGANTGAVFVYELEGNAWSQMQVLSPNDKTAWSHFGGSVSIRNGIAAIGAYGHPNSTGAAYIFERDKAGQFTQTNQLLSTDGAQHHRFGNDVAVGDGYVTVGAPYSQDEQGSAYVYDISGELLRSTTPRTFNARNNARAGTVRSGISFEYFGNFDGHDYFVTTEELEYYDAHEMANVLGMVLNQPASLAIINSYDESAFVQEITTERLWIGLSDLATESVFEWDNGEAFDWSDWGGNEPNKNGGTEDVVVMNWSFSDGKYLGWNDWKEQHRYSLALIELEGEACTGDTDFDDDIDGDDLAIIIATWGDADGVGDVNQDGAIDITDLLWLLEYWGACP